MPRSSNQPKKVKTGLSHRAHRLLTVAAYKVALKLKLIGSVKALIQEENTTTPLDVAEIFDPETVARANLTISKDELQNKIHHVNLKKQEGNREESFFLDFETIVCEVFIVFPKEYSLVFLREYALYHWEGSYVSEKIVKIIKNTIVALESKQQFVPDQLRLLYAGMMAQISSYSEVVKSVKKLKNNGDLPRHLGVQATLHKCNVPKQGNLAGYNLFNLLRENEKTFQRLVHEVNGDVRIIGNGPQILGQSLGPEIDASGLVVRFNTFDTSFPYSNDIGTKTDVWVRMVPAPYVKREPDLSGLKCVMVTTANRLYRPFSDWDWFHANMNRLPSLCFLPSQPFIELCEELGRIPTAGLVLSYMLYREIGPLPENTVLGASFAEPDADSRMYHVNDRDARMSRRHSIDKEREFFKKISRKDDRWYYTPLEISRRSVFSKPNATPSFTAQLPDKIVKSEELGWNVQKYLSQFKDIYTTSKGLVEYKVSGRDLCLFEPDKKDIIQNKEDALIIGFGLRGSATKALELRESLEVHTSLAEYGLISGLSIPSKTPFKFSLILDDIGIFFDATNPSRTLSLLEEDPSLDNPNTIERAKHLISKIVENNIVKYNDAPLMNLEVDPEKHKILVIDQTKGDLSISLGGCEAFSFDDMLEHALSQENAQVFVKLHPETSQGVKGANFDIGKLEKDSRITLIKQDCNIMHQIKQVDEIYTMTSGAGLEGIMAGKKVRCFGVPFYSGWGLTEDMQTVERPRTRSIEEIVSALFFRQTLWFDPETREETTPEATINKLLELRGELSIVESMGGRNIILNPDNKHEIKYIDNIRKRTDTIDVAIARRFITNDDVVLDAGANIGFTALNYASLNAKRVDSFEPVSKFFNRLNLLSDDTIKAHNCALGNFDGESEINISTAHDQGSTLSSQMVSNFREIFSEQIIKETIQVRQLDSLIEEGLPAPTFMKIDVEGFELEMLEGGKKLFENRPPKAVQIELYDHQYESVSEWLLKYYNKVSRAVQVKGNRKLQLLPSEKELSTSKFIGILPPVYVFEKPKKFRK